MTSNHPHVGSNLLLASTLALLSYAPFAVVAQGSLLLAVILFVMDPIPPTSRLLAVLFVIFIGMLSRLRRHWMEAPEEEDEYVVVTAEDESEAPTTDKKKN
jgi:hypothetical protein